MYYYMGSSGISYKNTNNSKHSWKWGAKKNPCRKKGLYIIKNVVIKQWNRPSRDVINYPSGLDIPLEGCIMA